jgi:hypothetical protein
MRKSASGVPVPAALLLLFAFVMWPAVIGRYGFFVDFQMLWTQIRSWPGWMPDHIQDVAVGRWLGAEVMSTYLIWIRTFAELDVGRAMTIVLIALAAFVLSRQIRRAGFFDAATAVAIAAAVFLIPPSFRALVWITSVPQTVIGAFIALWAWQIAARTDAALLLRAGPEASRPALMPGAFAASCASATLILLAGCFVYAPAAMTFCVVPVLRLLAAPPDRHAFARDAAVRDLAIAALTSLLYLVILKYIYQPLLAFTDAAVSYQLHQLSEAGRYATVMALDPGALIARTLWAIEIAFSTWFPPSLWAAMVVGAVVLGAVVLSWGGRSRGATVRQAVERLVLIAGFGALCVAPAVVAAPALAPATGYVAYRTDHASIAIAAAACVWGVATIASRLGKGDMAARTGAFFVLAVAALLGLYSVATTAGLARAEWRDVSRLVAAHRFAPGESLIVLTDFRHPGLPELNFGRPWNGRLTWPLELSCFSSVCTADTEIFRYALREAGAADWQDADIRVAEREAGDTDCAAAARRLGVDLARWRPVCLDYSASWLPRGR